MTGKSRRRGKLVHDTRSIGIDFGTTNTVVATARPGEPVRAVQFNDDRELSDIYRSVGLRRGS